jgi:hypothetical protein
MSNARENLEIDFSCESTKSTKTCENKIKMDVKNIAWWLMVWFHSIQDVR